MENQPNTKLPRGQAGLNVRAKKVAALPRYVKWRQDLDRAQQGLISRAAQGHAILKKNLPRLDAALTIAESAYKYRTVEHDVATLPEDMKAPLVVGHADQFNPERTYSEDALKAIQTMLQVVPDATVNWHGLVIKTHLGD